MQLSLSCRIAEGFLSKEEASMPLEQLADLAVAAGYDAICMRASQIGVHSTPEDVRSAKKMLDRRGLGVTMISGDFDIVYNNERGPNCLREITPYLNLAESLGAPLIRVCLKTASDVAAAQRAADEAAERGLQLVHQCHAQSLFETVAGITTCLKEINRPNFGLIFEAANLVECGQEYGPDVVRELGPWIKNVYLQNQRFHPDGSIALETWCRGTVTFDLCEIPDPGGIDFSAVFQGLQQIGYDGVITVHQSAPHDGRLSAQDSATQTARFLKTLWRNERDAAERDT